MKKNVGTFDALMRITWGLVGLSWGISRMVHLPHRGLPVLVSMMSAMKVAEGVTRYCPVLDMLKINTLDKSVDQTKDAESENSVINPS